MLDLRKYEIRAKADPDFEGRLLQNANQAIKDEFGEDLPYKLKCKKKLVFEIETTDSSSEVADWGSVAVGGCPPSKGKGGFGRVTIPPGWHVLHASELSLNNVMLFDANQRPIYGDRVCLKTDGLFHDVKYFEGTPYVSDNPSV